jgi:hypothetical protein
MTVEIGRRNRRSNEMYENMNLTSLDQMTAADTIMLSLQVRQFRTYDAMTLAALLEETGLTMDEADAGLEMLDNCSEIIIDRSGEETYIRIAE